ncbi:DUF6678 family protein [Shinella sp.]|uniref:DUF6678 family protein n=1 Tax=Shinella sp. TaxID=1870904 RepID=UPI004036A237
MRKTVSAGGFASHMNDTKWSEFRAATQAFPFPLAYQVKVVKENELYHSGIEFAPTYSW